MTRSEKFCLRFNDFEGNAKIYWQELQSENDFYDLTLACDERLIKTHKLVISSFSSVLRNILKLNQSPHPVIYLTKVKYRNLQNLLDFMYQGEVNVSEEDLPSFLEVAEDLNVRGLCERNADESNSKREAPSQFTNQNINPSSVNKRTSKIEKVENCNSQTNKSGNSFDNFINHVPKEIIKEVTNQESADDDDKNVVSTVAIPDEGESYSCVQCDFKTKFKYALKPHIKSVHEGVRYPCDQCGYKAAYKQSLRIHVKSIHENETYPCEQCEYRATNKDNLRVHKLKKHN